MMKRISFFLCGITSTSRCARTKTTPWATDRPWGVGVMIQLRRIRLEKECSLLSLACFSKLGRPTGHRRKQPKFYPFTIPFSALRDRAWFLRPFLRPYPFFFRINRPPVWHSGVPLRCTKAPRGLALGVPR